MKQFFNAVDRDAIRRILKSGNNVLQLFSVFLPINCADVKYVYNEGYYQNFKVIVNLLRYMHNIIRTNT